MIKTRSAKQQSGVPSATAGKKEYTLHLGEAELRYIASLTWLTRLGYGTYEHAACNLMGAIESMTQDEDFASDSCDLVDPTFVICDDNDDPVDSFTSECVRIEL